MGALALFAVLLTQTPPAKAQARSGGLSLPSEFFLETATVHSHMTAVLDAPSQIYASQLNGSSGANTFDRTGISIRSNRLGIVIARRQIPTNEESTDLGVVFGRRFRLGLFATGGIETERRFGPVSTDEPDRQVERWNEIGHIGGGIVVGWHDPERLVAILTFQGRQERLVVAKDNLGTLYKVDAWGSPAYGIEGRIERNLGRIGLTLAGRFEPTRVSFGTMSAARSDTTEGRFPIGEYDLDDQFLGASVRWSASRTIAVHAAGWIERNASLGLASTTCFEACLGYQYWITEVDDDGVGVGAAWRFHPNWELRGGISTRRFEESVQLHGVTYAPYWNLGFISEHQVTSERSAEWRRGVALGIGFEGRRLRIDAVIDTGADEGRSYNRSAIDPLSPFLRLDATIFW